MTEPSMARSGAVCGTALGLLLLALTVETSENRADDLLIITTANGTLDGFQRFQMSAKAAGIEVIGLERPDAGASESAGHQVNRLRALLERRASNPRRLVLVLAAPASDVIVAGSAAEISAAFGERKKRVVFAAAADCRPDPALAERYPPADGYRFLNSAAYMGYGPDLVAMLSDKGLRSSDGGQLAFVRLFLDKKRRNKYDIGLDHRADIFQNLGDNPADVAVRFRGTTAFVQNVPLSSSPLVVIGGETSRPQLNTFGNYLAGAWNPRSGCGHCWLGQQKLGDQPEALPAVFVAVFADRPIPFLEEFLDNLRELLYPKRKMDLFVYSGHEYNDGRLAQFADKFRDVYRSVTLVGHRDGVAAVEARQKAIEKGLETDAEYFLFLDATAHLNNHHSLKLLVEQNRDIVAPMMAQPITFFANFMNELGMDRVSPSSKEYKGIVTGKLRGLWHVPYVSECYLVKRHVLSDESTRPDFSGAEDVHGAFSAAMRKADKFMYVSNRLDFGHLVSADGFDTSHLHSEMWELVNNRWDWEQRYLHPNFSRSLDPSLPVEEPCPDVFWAPIVSERFCREMIETMEDHGKWSTGANQDSRIQGGYENVPTRDIHMKQIRFDKEWHQILQDYIQPVQQRVFLGYEDGPPRAPISFVVRYRPDEQPALRPHNDASTYTINIALNAPGQDYEGGGCRFIRRNCSVTASRRGWLLMHPGQLTHYHEGLPTTKGTRYILVSFVDPQ